ncbi:MAG: DUF4198 domain-containing protein [Acidobacteriota bacterium]
MQIKKIIFLFVVVLCLGAVSEAHTLFLKMDTFFVDSEGQASVYLVNGTFDKSENTVKRDRMADVSIVIPGGERTHPENALWRDVGMETFLDFQTSGPGTYVVGVSTYTLMIELTADEFNEYLHHDGVDDVLEARKNGGRLGEDATERYSKHVKAIIQVGDELSADFSAELGYPVEIVPLQNPYTLTEGEIFRARVLKNGKPLSGQQVYASYEGFTPPEDQPLFHGQDHHSAFEDHDRHMEPIETLSDRDGIIEFMLSGTGRWYVRFINMIEINEPGIDYESNWATLTFEVRGR